MIDEIIKIQSFGLLLTLITFWMGVKIHEKYSYSFLNPLLIATVLTIIFLKVNKIEFELYAEQNVLLYFMLGPATVGLAVPLYKQREILKKHCIAIFIGVLGGCITTMSCVVLFGKLFGGENQIILSMIPKGVTNPIAIEVSKIIGGIDSLTAGMVVIAGVFGASFGPELLKFFGVKNKIASGIAMGSMSHALGTSRAFKEGEIEGSMSSLAMGLAGVITAILSPYFAMLLTN